MKPTSFQAVRSFVPVQPAVQLSRYGAFSPVYRIRTGDRLHRLRSGLFEAKEEAMIYFVQEAGNESSPIKIGYTAHDAKTRLGRLQTGYPAPLCLLGQHYGGPVEEAKEHRRWAHLRLYGEWFKGAPALLEYIRGLGCDPVVFGRRARLATKATTENPAWTALTRKEPRLRELLGRARSVQDDGEDVFCANHRWYGCGEFRTCPVCKGGLKLVLSTLVGRNADNIELEDSKAYDLAYETIYQALPDCRGCNCP